MGVTGGAISGRLEPADGFATRRTPLLIPFNSADPVAKQEIFVELAGGARKLSGS
jgi:hypothetical protein